MAMQSLGFFLSVTLSDNSAVLTTLEYQMTAATIATAITDAAIIVAALTAVTNLTVKNQSISQRFYDDAFTNGSGNAKVKGVVSGLILGNPSKSAAFAFPDPKDAVLGAPGTRGYNVINLAANEMVDYAGIFQTSGQSKISDGEVLGELTGGKRVTRGSTNP